MTFALQGPPHVFRQISPQVWAFVDKQGHANVGVIVAPEGLVVVDTTLHPAFAEPMALQLQKTFERPLLYVINTHFHRDHTFGNQCFNPERGFVGHRLCAQYLIQEGERWRQELDPVAYADIRIIAPSITFDSELVLDLSVEVVLRHTGGHSNDSILVWLPEDRILLAGDTLFNGIAPYTGRWSCVDGFGSIESWIQALSVAREFSLVAALPGHGDIGGPDALDTLARFFEYYAAAVDEGVRQGRDLREIWLPIYHQRDFVRPEVDPYVYLYLVTALYEELRSRAPAHP